MVSDELRTTFKHYQNHGGHSSPPGRAACNLRDARDDMNLRRLIEAGRARVEISEDPTPWEGGVPYTGTLFMLAVHIGDDVEYLGGIATDDSDVVAWFDPNGIQAVSGEFGVQGGQCTARGYLRVCAVEVAQGMAGFEDAVERLDNPVECLQCGSDDTDGEDRFCGNDCEIGYYRERYIDAVAVIREMVDGDGPDSVYADAREILNEYNGVTS